jgi:hypothetical protein
VTIGADIHILTAADPLSAELQDAVDTITSPADATSDSGDSITNPARASELTWKWM